ncbi:hypothetical protein [Phaeocystidibacter luteus]|uniref:PEP-CTERM sorting domain-containing protein n=1 Tax=Phaeocystidibacter luteus TaxID=911197 RepID=A0A6N6RKM1_9FLAO|nr:hypothetical protein [Phaeocystidibacter luteus]KAB2807724.1 hypothetical protein F8C67_11835 [Phaeocystidibacter luteus]
MSVLNKTTLTFALLTVAGTVLAFAQPGNPSTPAPLGFMEVLLLTGAAYGAKKISQKRKS